MVLHGIYKGILNGLHERGEGGFLYVRNDEAAYLFPHELKNQKDLQDGLQEMLEGDAARHVFYVVEETAGKCHVLAYPREVVWKTIKDELLRDGGRGSEEGGRSIHGDGGDGPADDSTDPLRGDRPDTA